MSNNTTFIAFITIWTTVCISIVSLALLGASPRVVFGIIVVGIILVGYVGMLAYFLNNEKRLEKYDD